ncbi:MAG TPA: S41 family peptidase [Pyrinomonadaceae bacterium]|nr:S41 family peptidase [Pyrinomonadaceae bacterium]
MKTFHKPLAFFLSFLLLAPAFCQTAQAQTAAAGDARIARLAGLARVWGTVKYFHPFLAYRDIDWDKALIETIPKVNAARSPQDYQTALNQMLAVLNDKSTRAEIETEKKPTTAAAPADASKLVRTENGVLIIDAAQITKAVANDISQLNKLIANINESLPKAGSVIIDARGTTKPTEIEAYYFDTFMRQALAGILDGTVVLGATRYRMHNGYATQVGGGANFYYSGLINSSPQTIDGRSKTKTPPIVFIINQNSLSFANILSGMQAAGRAVVVQEGESPTSDTFTIDLPESVKVRMRTVELVNPDGSIELQPDVTVAKGTSEDTAFKEAIRAAQEKRVAQRQNRAAAPATGQLAQKDQPYAEMTFPTAEYRLLALFRYWNVINYFFPYKHLIGDSWETVLPRYIPKFEANKDALDYQLTVRELVTEMRDSHGGVRNANAASEKFGTHLPSVLMGYVENKSVVTKVLDDKLPVKVGDVVLAVDGEAVEKRREYLARYTAASTPQWLMRNVNGRLLLGSKDSVVKLKVQSPGAEAREVELTRSQPITDPKWFRLLERSTPVMQVLPSGVGYADLDRLQVGEVEKMFETIKGTPAVIFDMRGYPNGTAWSIAPRLTEKGNVVAALFSRPILEATSLTDSELAEIPGYSFSQRIPDPQGEVYKGKVVVLINEDAISQAEHTCLFFEAATDVTFIGTPTAGANGDVTLMVLPGNLTVSFSGHDVRHADGRQLQRVGIQPTIKVAPTIRGLVEGRDEILEAAINFLKDQQSRVTTKKP